MARFLSSSSAFKYSRPRQRLFATNSYIFEGLCDEQTGLRLDTYLTRKIQSTTRSQINQSIKNGFVQINGKPCTKPAYSIKLGDKIWFEVEKKIPSTIVPEAIPLEIVHEDEDIIVINKPAGMVVHPSAGHWQGTLVNALMYHAQCPPLSISNPPKVLDDVGDDDISEEELEISSDTNLDVFRPGIVHRLDIGTSGLLVVAKNVAAHHQLTEKFKDRTISRRYLSLLIGNPREKQGRVETNIDRDPKDRKLQKAFPYQSSQGRTAISNFDVLSAENVYPWLHALSEEMKQTVSRLLSVENRLWSLVSWKLETGQRKRRVHAKHLGCPIIGDAAYGGDEKRFLSQSRNPKSTKRLLESIATDFPERPMLHSHTLQFDHPRTQQPLSFTAALPEDLLSCLELLVSVNTSLG